MKLDEKILKRFDELIEKANVVEKSKYTDHIDWSLYLVETDIFNEWAVSCLHLISQVFDAQSEHYESFKRGKELNHYPRFQDFSICLGTLKAAKEDYEKGYIFNIRTLISAEIFEDFIEEAKELIEKSYIDVAAAFLRTIILKSFRKLCEKSNIELSGKAGFEVMSVELVKKGVINESEKKIFAGYYSYVTDVQYGKIGRDKIDITQLNEIISSIQRFNANYLI